MFFPAAAFAGHHFHAVSTAVAIDGDDSRPAVASVALPSSGGTRSASVSSFNYEGIIRFDSGESMVEGYEKDGEAVTISTVTIRNLDIAGVIRADAVISRITSRHRTNAAEADITFEGSEFRNLTIHGVPVDVELDLARYAAFPTFALLRRDIARREGIRVVDRDDSSAGVISEALVRSPLRVPIEGVGTVYLGEVQIKFGQRRLTMIRIEPEPGSKKRFAIMIADGDSNGSPSWP